MMRFTVLLYVAIAAMFAASPASADDKCTCRALGKNYELGSVVCLRTPCGFRLATCGTVLNNTAWHFSETPCVSSRRSWRERFAALMR